MDFALAASDLSSSPIPAPQALAEEPNPDWILSWLEAAPFVQAPDTLAPSPRMASTALGAPSVPIYGLVFEVTTPQAPEQEPEEEVSIVVHAEESVAEPISLEAPDLEQVDEEADELSDCVTPPATVATHAPIASTAPDPNDEAPPKQYRGPEVPRPRQATDPTGSRELQVIQPPGDKGEIIWEADLVVAAPEVTRAFDVPPNDVNPRREDTDTPAVQMESVRSQASSQESATSHEQEPEDAREAPAAEGKRKQAAQSTSKPEGERVSEPEPRAAKRVQPAEKPESPLPFSPPKQTSSDIPTEPKFVREDGVAAVNEIAPTLRTRPTQIARVQVDVGTVDKPSGGDPAMRLVLTQRGENVSVQVRSWNDTTAPLTAKEVQPLLENLAKQGLAPAPETAAESAALVDAPKERTVTFGQPAASDPDTRGFNGFDERQQRQQEQHRQQQEGMARRHQRTAVEFDLNSMLDEIQTR